MIVCIEGPSGAGKSTLANQLCETWEDFQLCPTVDHFLGGFPVCQTESEIEQNFSKFLGGEVQANRYMQESEGKWVQDRSWVSQLTFLESIELLSGLDLRPLKARIVEELESGRLELPSAFIYMRCSPDTTAARRQLRGTTKWGDVPPWVVDQSKATFRELRSRSYEDLFGTTFIEAVVVDSAVGPESVDWLQNQLCNAQFDDQSEIVLRLRSRILS